jgi:hypothetical protein
MFFIWMLIRNLQFIPKLLIIMTPGETLPTFQFAQYTFSHFQFFKIAQKKTQYLKN